MRPWSRGRPVMHDDRETSPPDPDEALVQRLRALVEERDPVPDQVTAAARSALSARKPVDAEPPSQGT